MSLMKNETINNKKYFRFQKEMVNNLVVAPYSQMACMALTKDKINFKVSISI